MKKYLIRYIVPICIGIVMFIHIYILHLFERMSFSIAGVIAMIIPVLIIFEIDRMVTNYYQKKHLNKKLANLAIVPFLVSFGISWLLVFSVYIPRKLYEISTIANDTISLFHITSISIQIFITVAIANAIHQVGYLGRKWREESNRTSELEKENLSAKLTALKDQISPHFLFNNLNTLYGLIDNHPEKAKKYLKTLSTIYRQVLSNNTEEAISLKKELTNLNDYVFLLKIRFSDSILIKQTVDLNAQTLFIPPLSIQMLVENAIKHNKFDKETPLLITIFNDQNTLVVENTLNSTEKNPESIGIGLQNIKNRYRLLSNSEISIKVSKHHFTVKIPLLKITN